MKRWDLLAELLVGLVAVLALAGAVRAEGVPPGALGRMGAGGLRHSHTGSGLGFSAGGKRLVSASWDETARVWEVASGREVCRFTGHRDGASAAAISPDGTLCASGDMNRTTFLWDATTGKEIHRVQDNENTVFWLKFSA